MTSSRTFFTTLALLLLAVTTAPGDTLWISSGGAGANALEAGGVKVTGIQDGRLLFTTAGRESARDVRQIVRIAVDDEPALNAGEEALAKGLFDVATDQFRKALASSTKEWVKQWAAQRLTVTGQRANRFDAAAAGYVALLLRDPARAAEYKPAPPASQSTFLASAVGQVDAALATPNLSAAQKQAMESYRAELQAIGGLRAAPVAPTAAAAQPGGSAVADAASAAAAAAAGAQQARGRLDVAAAALERKDFSGAINEIKSNPRLFTEPREQAQALYYLAEAQTGLAAAKNDVPSWQDAALAYMRVVAHFEQHEAVRPFVARSMLKAAQIQETLRDPQAARLLYEQLVAQFPADPAAKDAKAALDRLQQTG